MNDGNFDLITKELLRQQQAMRELQAENRELRQQLMDLRTGRGIFIEINGHRFALNASSISQLASVSPKATMVADDATTAIYSIVSSVEATQNVVPSQDYKNVLASSPTFLEEAMIGEFASAMDSPLALLQNPTDQQQQEKLQSKEEQLAVLRRDLMGSFLLD
jgi:hypothetical protein